MKKYVNGEYIDMTAEEVAEIQRMAAEAEAYERTRPLTEQEVSRMIIADRINALDVDDNTALRMVEFYPEWQVGVFYGVGFKVQRNGILYKTLTAHTSQEAWVPEDAPSLFAKVLIPDENETPEWEQPDSTNAYSKGDRVSYNGKTWESDVDGNVWAPGVYGWTEIAG